ncbi:MAG TPA: quinone oxidoreductase [Polyangiales bacterium]|jgi:NADPH2:quinone reductase
MGKAILIEQTGGPEVLSLRDYDPGAPGPGHVRIKVEAAGVNFIDTYLRSGLYARPLPFVLGSEGAGVVERLGSGVQGLAVGTRVAWASVSGSYAEHVLAPIEALAVVPDQLSNEVAAAAMLQGMTAHYLAHGVRTTKPGDVALVHAASGGTGQLLVQMLKLAGARVFGTCSTEAKAELARAAGVDEVIRYDRDDFASEARRLTDKRGVDVVYDGVGRTTFEGSLKALRPRGLLAIFGQASGVVPPFDLQKLNQGGSLFVTRPSLVHYIATRAEFELRSHAVLSAAVSGGLRVRIDRRLSLSQAADAHRLLEGRASSGKLLLLP